MQQGIYLQESRCRVRVEPIFRIKLVLYPSSRPNGTGKIETHYENNRRFQGVDLGLKRGIDTLSRGLQITEHARWPFSSRHWELRSLRFVRFKLSGASRSDAKFRRPLWFCTKFSVLEQPPLHFFFLYPYPLSFYYTIFFDSFLIYVFPIGRVLWPFKKIAFEINNPLNLTKQSAITTESQKEFRWDHIV